MIDYFLNNEQKYLKEVLLVHSTWALAIMGYYDERLYMRVADLIEVVVIILL